jgi:hypothetical protein
MSGFGFWSYAHGDNELDNGAILELANLAMQEYDLLSGVPLKIFVDRDSLAWGDEWKVQVDKALTRTTFFIPVITPRYFTRPECRRELLEFSAKAKALGTEELILPILYVKPVNFSQESPDEAVALVARMQYADWTEARLQEPRSREYRIAVNTLATRLIEIAARLSEAQLNREVLDASPEVHAQETAGVGDIMLEVSALLPDWLDVVLGDRVVDAQVEATWRVAYGPVVKLQKSHAPASAVFAAQMRVGREILPILERHLADARIYLSRSVELDALVSRLILLTSSHLSDLPLLEPLISAIDEAFINIQTGIEKAASGSHSTVRDHFFELKGRARLFQKLDAVMAEASQVVDEGNTIVLRWHSELSALRPSEQLEA